MGSVWLALAVLVGVGGWLWCEKAKNDALPAEEQRQAIEGVQLWANGPYWAECNLGALF